MNSTKSRLRFPYAALLLLLSFASASAYYDPGVQRWLNRDPINETGFELTSGMAQTRLPGPDQEANLFCFVQNQPTAYHDAFGLQYGPGWTPGMPDGICRSKLPPPCLVTCVLIGSPFTSLPRGWFIIDTVTDTYSCTDCNGKQTTETRTRRTVIYVGPGGPKVVKNPKPLPGYTHF